MFETLTLDQLRLFLCVVDEGSFSAAGRKLNRVQSAVSQGISNLEETLGVVLFDRRGRRPKLTPNGRSLLLDAQQVFSHVSQLRTRAATIAQGLEAEVSIVVDAIVPAEMLVEMCRGFQAQFPTVSLRIHTEVLKAVANKVLDGSCHLGIGDTTHVDGFRLTQRFLTDVALLPVAGASHPLASFEAPIPTTAVRDHIQVVISQRSQGSSGDQGVLSRHTWRVADAATKLALIRAGLGWGNLPCEMVRNDLQTGTLVRLQLEEWGQKPILAHLSVITLSDAPPGPAGQWLLQQLDLLFQKRNQLEQQA